MYKQLHSRWEPGHFSAKWSKKIIPLTIAFGLLVAVMVVLVAVTPGGKVYADINNTRADASGTLELAGSGWLNGNGVDILSNGNSASNTSGTSCVALSGASATSHCAVNTMWAGDYYQCVEMVNRLYITRGWISSTWSGNGNQLYGNAPSTLTKEANGSITYLNPGDVIGLDDGGNGHAGIVNNTSGGVQIVNQNTVAVYSSATLSSGSISMSGWAGYSVQGVIHAPAQSPPTPSSTVGSSPTAIVDPTHGRQIFYRGTDGAMYQWSVSGSSWVNYRIGGAVLGGTSPFAVTDSTYGREIFYVGTDNAIHQWSVSGGSWVDVKLGSSNSVYSGSSPTATVDSTYGQQVFYVGSDDALHQWSVSGGSWVDYKMSGNGAVATSSGPSAVVDSTYGRQIFEIGSDYAVHQWSVSGGAWADFKLGSSSSAASNTSPNVIIDPTYGRQIFFIGSDSAVHQWSVSGGSWVNYGLGGTAASYTGPSAITDSTNGRNIFFMGTSGTVYQWAVSGGSWTQNSLGGKAASSGTSPSSTDESTYGRQIFYIGSDGAMWQWSVSGSSWVNFRLG